ncbi:MAG: ribonuclease HII [Coriobacteriia bacterium]|nr:ribonuclease HII [Coriobacteriia bacterium]MBN2840972.1 ribonuclease HII [Coriobacteriia bacterium]
MSVIAEELASADPGSLVRLIMAVADDSRAGVREAVARAERRMEAVARESARLEDLARIEIRLIDGGCRIVAGVDEVGRGALAGPVTACACVFARDTHVHGVNDSKRLSPMARERLDSEIRRSALGVAVAHVGPEEIDRIGIAGATLNAMRQAIAALPEVPDHVLVDGLPVDIGRPCTALVSGDALTRAIGAASIVAKVERDHLMEELDSRYPGYGFAGNKGYGSAPHIEAIRTLGPSPVHRMSFSPCSSLRLF